MVRETIVREIIVTEIIARGTVAAEHRAFRKLHEAQILASSCLDACLSPEYVPGKQIKAVVFKGVEHKNGSLSHSHHDLCHKSLV